MLAWWWWCGAVARGEGSSGLRSTLTTQPYYYYLDFCVDSVVFVCGTGSRSGLVLVALVWKNWAALVGNVVGAISTLQGCWADRNIWSLPAPISSIWFSIGYMPYFLKDVNGWKLGSLCHYYIYPMSFYLFYMKYVLYALISFFMWCLFYMLWFPFLRIPFYSFHCIGTQTIACIFLEDLPAVFF